MEKSGSNIQFWSIFLPAILSTAASVLLFILFLGYGTSEIERRLSELETRCVKNEELSDIQVNITIQNNCTQDSLQFKTK